MVMGTIQVLISSKYETIISHNEQLTGNSMCTVEQCHYLWPWVTWSFELF